MHLIWTIGNRGEGGRRAGATTGAAAAAAAATCRFPEGRGLELDCSSSNGESAARPTCSPPPISSLNHLLSTTPLCPPSLMKAYLGGDVPSGPLWESRGGFCWLSPLVPSGRPPAGSWSRKGGSTPAPGASGASRGRTTPASSSYFLPQHFSPH